MKRFRQWGGVVVLGLAVGCARPASRSSNSHDRVQAGRSFEFTYTASITNLPTEARQVRVWIPLAKTRDNQRIFHRDIHASVPYEIHQEPTYGNEMAYLTLTPSMPQPWLIQIDYRASVERGAPLGPRWASTLNTTASPEALQVTLQDEPFMVINDTVRHLAHEAVAGRTTNLEKARALYAHVIQHMHYDNTTPGWGRGDTMRACVLGKGNCTDFHSLFISMARAVGIPAQFVIGAPIPEGPEGDVPGYHCWAEFYDATYGWIPVDASEAWKHPELREYYFGTRDPNRLLISVGRNLQLVPPQDGPPVNIFIYPYLEADGVPGGTVETRFRFRSRQEQEVKT